MSITSEEYENMKNASPIHPNEPERARRYREAFQKEQERKERELRLRKEYNLLKDEEVLRKMIEDGVPTAEIEKFIVGDKIDLQAYNEQLERELYSFKELG